MTNHIQISQRAGHDPAMSVLRQAAITHFGKFSRGVGQANWRLAHEQCRAGITALAILRVRLFWLVAGIDEVAGAGCQHVKLCLMKSRVYIETTIVSYLAARPSRDLISLAHQQITQNWWDGRRSCFELFASELIVREAGMGDGEAASRRSALVQPLPILQLNDVAALLARTLMKRSVHSSESRVRRLAHFGGDGARHGLFADVELQTHCQRGNAQSYRYDLSCRRL